LIGDVLIARIAELDNDIVDGAGKIVMADKRRQELARAAGSVTWLAERHQLPPAIGQRIDVDTSQEPNLTDVVRAIRGALALLT
jgi:hypothetical protein